MDWGYGPVANHTKKCMWTGVKVLGIIISRDVCGLGLGSWG